ncbi:DUF624 domain-containing protein [Nonomuraea deserti]|uniref:DUF624 domain-containing protein n=1 Tax=Nonomuraea deserti TaxID=1848322 RepID=A0A4R4U4X2_9ACTN|nr:DUF624 domain-containing protein [Nonomuraea deserti]TDC86378.1 DUF624 domain-containing protein [Nonomuraea deserti]
MSDAPAERRFGTGPLSRVAALVYTLLVVELLFLVTAAPGLAALVLLDRDAGNVPLAALCALPAGPALSAALYALRHRRSDLADLRPAAAFWRGYRGNVAGVMKIWAPWLAGLAIVGTNLANFAAAGVPGWWAVLLVAVAVAAALWAAAALVITSLFEFRAADVARLASYSLVRFPGATVSNLCLLVVAAGLTLVATEAAVTLLAVLFAAALLRNSRPMIDEIRERFTA